MVTSSAETRNVLSITFTREEAAVVFLAYFGKELTNEEMQMFRSLSKRYSILGSRANAGLILQKCLEIIPDTTDLQRRKNLELQGTLGEQIRYILSIYSEISSLPSTVFVYYLTEFNSPIIHQELMTLAETGVIEEQPFESGLPWHYRTKD